MNLKKDLDKLNNSIDRFDKKAKENVLEKFKVKDIQVEYLKLDNKIRFKKDNLLITELSINTSQKENLNRGILIKEFELRIQELNDILTELKSYSLDRT